MHSQLKVIKTELSKVKSSNKVSHAADEFQFLMDFNSSITQSMAKTLEYLTDFLFVQGQTNQFKSLPFGLSTAPLMFTVVAKEVKLMAIHKGIGSTTT